MVLVADVIRTCLYQIALCLVAVDEATSVNPSRPVAARAYSSGERRSDDTRIFSATCCGSSRLSARDVKTPSCIPASRANEA